MIVLGCSAPEAPRFGYISERGSDIARISCLQGYNKVPGVDELMRCVNDVWVGDVGTCVGK